MGEPSSRLRTAGAGFALLLLGLPASAGARENAPSAVEAEQDRLRRVRKEIERLETALGEARQQENSLMGDLHRLDMELELHRRQIQLLEGEMARCRQEIAETTREAERLRTRLALRRSLLTQRLRALYVSGPLNIERVMLQARSPGEVADAYQIASRLLEADGERITAFRSDLESLQIALATLEDRRTSLAALRSQEMTRRQELEGIRTGRSRLLGGVRREAEARQGALKEMAETERDLQRLVETLASGGAVSPELKVGFDRFRGILPWPVPGKVLVPFGARKSSKFETLVPHPGLDLASTVGEPVRAVFDGVVAFSDWFKGYGNLVILEHGGGFMTVYAHASERLVAPGERVVGGQVIALGGDTGSLEGPKLYFEIWRDGRPEDPAGWLARR